MVSLVDSWRRFTTRDLLGRPASALRLGVIAIVLTATGLPVARAADGTWNLPGAGDWNDPASWLGGVPGAGDSATFDTLPTSGATVTLGGPTNAGALNVANNSLLTFVGDPLTFDTLDSSVDAAMFLTGEPTMLTFDVNVVLQNDLRVGGVGDYLVVLNGGIGPSGGRLINDGIGELQLNGDSSAWSGDLVVDDGHVVVNHAQGLGDTTGRTLVNGGRLELNVASSEPIMLAGGEVVMLGAGHANPIASSGGLLMGTDGDLSGPLVLSGGTTSVNGSRFRIGGGTSGSGDLVLSGGMRNLGIEAPLGHVGTTTIERGTVGIRIGGAVFPNSDVFIDGGRMNIAPTVTESIQVGRLTLRSNGVISRSAATDPAVGLSFSELIVESGEIGVPLQGDGSLIKNSSSTLILDQDNSYTGETVINGGTVVVDHPNGLGTTDGGTRVGVGAMLDLRFSTAESLDIDDAQIVVNGSEVELSGAIVVSGGSTISAPGIDAFLDISGPISSTGSLSFAGSPDAHIVLSGNNSYTGPTVIDGARVLADHPNALGTSSGTDSDGTLVNAGGTLLYSQLSSQTPFTPEKIVLDGGTLGADPSTRNGDPAVIVPGMVELASDSHIVAGGRRLLELEGSITGPGGLSITGISPPSLVTSRFNQVFLNGPTSYSGETVIGPDVFVAFQHPDNLGDLSAGTRVLGGKLFLNGGTSSEDIEVDEGELILAGGPSAYNHSIVLKRGVITGSGSVPAELSTVLVIDGGAQLGFESSGSKLVLSAGVTGSGSLHIINEFAIQGPLSHNGDLVISDRGDVDISGRLDHPGDFLISSAIVNFSADVGPFQQDVIVTGSNVSVNLNINADNTLRRVILDPRNTDRENVANRYRIRVAEGNVLTVSEELRYLGGTLEGRFVGQDTLIKRSNVDGWLQDIGGSSFQDIRVEGGTLNVTGSLGDAPPDLHLRPSSRARLNLHGLGTYQGDIYLNNVTGDANNGALLAQNGTTLAGNIFLGDRGASIDAGDVAGSIHGGTLHKVGSRDLVLRGDGHTYSGDTAIHNGKLLLIDQGALNSTSQVIVDGTPYAELVLDNSGSEGRNDRIPDSTPVTITRAKVTLIGRDSEATSEVIGNLTATAGFSEIVVQNGTQPGSETTLLINVLQREHGATIKFDTDSTEARILFSSPPTLDDKLIGGWAVFGKDDFATYGPDGVTAYSDLHSYAMDLDTAAATDNVLVAQNTTETLTADRNINALMMRSGDIALDGHTLNVESGGILISRSSRNISGGTLTAGGDKDGELIINAPDFGVLTVDADITDNEAGSIGLNVSDSSLTLTGSNSYTGPTTVNSAQLHVAVPSALPANTDVTINGGILRIDFEGNEPIDVGNLVVRQGGQFVLSEKNGPPINADSYQFESGVVEAELFGVGPMVKTGLGRLTLTENSPNYTGPITVEQGILRISFLALGGGPLDEDHAIIVRAGGTLITGHDDVLTNRKIILDGGNLQGVVHGGISGRVEVRSASTIGGGRGIFVIGSNLMGSADLTVDGSFFGSQTILASGSLNGFEGDLTLTGGNVRIEGNNSSYTGTIDVSARELSFDRANALGGGDVNILPDSNLVVDQPLAAEIHLAGGGIRFIGNAGVVQGPLSIEKDARLFLKSLGPLLPLATIEGPLRLSDQVDLKIAPNLVAVRGPSRPLIRFAGDLMVDGDATITSYSAMVEITGTVESGAADATLNLVGNDTFDFNASIQVDEGRSLSVILNDVDTDLSLSGFGHIISGNGTLLNDILVTGGAAISPGASAGLLTIGGDVTFGVGGRFLVELGGTLRGEEYDALDVVGDALLEGLLEVSFVDDFVPSLDDQFVILAAGHVEGMFANAAKSIMVGGMKMPVTYLEDRVILTVVPEPSTLLLAAFAALGLLAFRARKLRRR